MTLYHGDCFEYMKTMADSSVDMVLTDPPYGINYHTNHRKKNLLPDIDANIDVDLLAKELFRITKDNAVVFIFAHWSNIDVWKQTFEKYFKLKNILVWEKQNWTAGDLYGNFGTKTEFILFLTKGRVRFRHGVKRPHNVLRFPTVYTSRKHLTEKPVPLLEYLINLFNVLSVCDPFMGVGSTGVACKNLGKEFYGCEINDYYFDIAKQRILGENNETL